MRCCSTTSSAPSGGQREAVRHLQAARDGDHLVGDAVALGVEDREHLAVPGRDVDPGAILGDQQRAGAGHPGELRDREARRQVQAARAAAGSAPRRQAPSSTARSARVIDRRRACGDPEPPVRGRSATLRSPATGARHPAAGSFRRSPAFAATTARTSPARALIRRASVGRGTSLGPRLPRGSPPLIPLQLGDRLGEARRSAGPPGRRGRQGSGTGGGAGGAERAVVDRVRASPQRLKGQRRGLRGFGHRQAAPGRADRRPGHGRTGRRQDTCRRRRRGDPTGRGAPPAGPRRSLLLRRADAVRPRPRGRRRLRAAAR